MITLHNSDYLDKGFRVQPKAPYPQKDNALKISLSESILNNRISKINSVTKQPITLFQRIVHLFSHFIWISRGQVAEKLHNLSDTLEFSCIQNDQIILNEQNIAKILSAIVKIRAALHELEGFGISKSTKNQIIETNRFLTNFEKNSKLAHKVKVLKNHILTNPLPTIQSKKTNSTETDPSLKTIPTSLEIPHSLALSKPNSPEKNLENMQTVSANSNIKPFNAVIINPKSTFSSPTKQNQICKFAGNIMCFSFDVFAKLAISKIIYPFITGHELPTLYGLTLFSVATGIKYIY